MKILDVQLFEQVVTDTQSALKEKSDQITDLQQAIDAFVNMEDTFKGKAGNAIRAYFRDFHQPFLLYLQSFLSEYNEQLNKILKDLSSFEPDPNGYIQEAFVQDGVISALKKLENTIGYLLEDANAAMRRVSDLISLPKLDVEEKLYYIQKARKKANKTLEHLYDFDSKAAGTLDSLNKDMDTMERFVRQMESMAGDGSLDIATYNPKQFVTTNAYRSLEGELIQKSGVKPVQTVNGKDFGRYLSVKFHIYKDGSIVMEYWKSGSKQLYYERVNEIPKEAIPGSENPDDPLYMDIWNGIYEGSGKAVGDTIEGLETLLDPRTYISMGYNGAKYVNRLISSPEETLKSTASRTIDMAKYMGMAVKNAFERDVINGDAKSRTAFFTYAFVFIGLSALGDKGISKISTAGKTINAGRLAEKAEKLRVNTEVTPALEATGAGPTKIPYNVMDDLGIRIQKAAEERWRSNKGTTNLNLKYKEGYYVEHTTGPVKKFTERNGVSGGHNYDEFKNYFESNSNKYELDTVVKKEHPSIDGVFDIEYKVKYEKMDYTGKNGTGEYKVIPNKDKMYKKTVYDPKIISDDEMINLSKKAMAEGLSNKRKIPLLKQKKIKIQGQTDYDGKKLKFEGIMNSETGEIENAYPVLEWVD